MSLGHSIARGHYGVLPDALSYYIPTEGFVSQDNLVYGGPVLVKPTLFGYFVRPNGPRYTFQYEQFFLFGGYTSDRTIYVMTSNVTLWILIALCFVVSLCFM